MYSKNKIRLLFLSILLPILIQAQPDFNQLVEYEGIRCFLDTKKENVAYYSPGKLSVATDREGKPDFNFLQTRYTGSVVYDDRNSYRFNSIISFRVIMEQIQAEKIKRMKNAIFPGKNDPLLLPLPVSNIKTNLIFISVEEGQADADSTVFTGGNLSSENNKGLNRKGTYWREREFSLRLDNHSSQALWEMLDNKQTLMSLNYAFFSEGIKQPVEVIMSDAEKKIFEQMLNQYEENEDSAEIKEICIKSDAFAIRIDTEKWPGLMNKVDINEQVPPGYAALEVRCYDFNDNLRPDLFAKQIEIKATGVGRGDVIAKTTFSQKAPDIYMQNIKFPYAVRLDKPLFYRVTSISQEKPPEKTEWIEQEMWADIIDITSSESEIEKINFDE